MPTRLARETMHLRVLRTWGEGCGGRGEEGAEEAEVGAEGGRKRRGVDTAQHRAIQGINRRPSPIQTQPSPAHLVHHDPEASGGARTLEGLLVPGVGRWVGGSVGQWVSEWVVMGVVGW